MRRKVLPTLLFAGAILCLAGPACIAGAALSAFHRTAARRPSPRLPFFWSLTGPGRAGRDLYVVANLRFATPGFLAGLIGSPAVFRVTPMGTSAPSPPRAEGADAKPWIQ